MTSDPALGRRVVAAGRDAGLLAVGITDATPFPETERALVTRKGRGYHAAMSFTYRNPSRSSDPRSVLPSARAVVVGAWQYPVTPPPRPAGASARVARYAWRDHYADLRGALDTAARPLVDAGFRAVIVADQNAQVDRAVAERAGIGWFGKNTNLLLDGVGSWFVLGSIVTDAPLAPQPATTDSEGCRTCTRCLTGCPTGAFVEPGVLDARRCLAWLVQRGGVYPRRYRRALGDRIYGCDECLDVCPPGRRVDDAALENRPVPTPVGIRGAEDETVWVDVVAMLRMPDDELLDRFGRWYIPGRDPAVLRRNALLVLANIGDGDDPDHVEVLTTALRDDRPLVRAHAVWAAACLGRHDLLDRLVDDPAPEVRAELALAPRPDHTT